jgi:hypothetical protein
MRDVLIVGSVPLANPADVIRAVCGSLGKRVRRVTDGETGARLRWIDWQTEVFERHPALQRAPDAQGVDADWRNKDGIALWKNAGWHMLRPGVKAADLEFGPLGYAATAIESYYTFKRLKSEGSVHKDCRFQVSLPTPYNVIDQRIVPSQRLAVEPAFERRMKAELDEIARSIPHAELAIQWDVAHEIENLEGARPHWFDKPFEGIINRLVRLGDSIPPEVELGYHLCYGDFAHRHIVEPKDMDLMVELSNALSTSIGRPMNWLHMPVPRDRIDDAYFAPLKKLQLGPKTRLYLGLIHFTDGVAGTRKRIAVAARYQPDFGIATECGFGRRPPETIPELLRIHAELADARG